jgi:hypothetical protein
MPLQKKHYPPMSRISPLFWVWRIIFSMVFGIFTVWADTVYIAHESQGQAMGTPAFPLRHLEGILSNTPAITGSVSIHLLYEGSGDLRALFIDQGQGQIVGLGLGAFDVQVATGSLDYTSGRWSVDLMPTGLVGTFNITASYHSGISDRPSFCEISGMESVSSLDPLIKMGGGLSHTDLLPGSTRFVLRRQSDAAVMGIFYDTGVGELVGATFLNSNLPEFAHGTINYRNGAWMLDIPMPGMIDNFQIESDYVADNRSLAAVNESVGIAEHSAGTLLLEIGGLFAHPHLVPGSVSIFLRSQATGRLLGFIEDATDGSLSGDLLYASLMPLTVQGVIVHEIGGWFADLAMPGADEDLNISVSYLYSNGPPRKIINSPQTIWGSDVAPLTSFAGQTRGAPVRPGTIMGWFYQQPENRMVGIFRDLGDGRLQGRYLFQGIVPVAMQGVIDYSSGVWSASLPYPGLVGTCSVWVCELPLISLSLPWDYNGDWQSDLAIYTNGMWSAQTLAGSNLFHGIAWGWSGALPIYGDYEGHLINNWTVYDPASGDWYIRSLSGAVLTWKKQWGYFGAFPVAGDYDHDGLYDFGVFGERDGRWYLRSSVGSVLGWGIQWGWQGVTPVSGDYDGDGVYDLAVFDPYSGSWYIRSLNGTILAWSRRWGWPGAHVVPGDYDGDDRGDLAVFDDQTGRWFIQSFTGKVLAWDLQWGWKGAVPVTGDFDGDGAFDLAVYHSDSSRWYVLSLIVGVIAWER